jgi:hypothetical protein
LRGRRDAALLALGFTGAFCHSELVALIAPDLVEVPDGLRIVLTFRRAHQLNTWDRCWPPQPSEEGNKIREAPVAR